MPFSNPSLKHEFYLSCYLDDGPNIMCVCKVNLKILDFQALEVIAIASKAGATVADVKT